MTCPTCLEYLKHGPITSDEEPGYVCPDCGGSGKAEDCIDPDDYRTGV